MEFKDTDIFLENVMRLTDEEKSKLLDILVNNGELFSKIIPGNRLLNYVRSTGKLPHDLLYSKTQ